MAPTSASSITTARSMNAPSMNAPTSAPNNSVPLITPKPGNIDYSGPFAVVQTILSNAQTYSSGAGAPKDMQSRISNLYSSLTSLNNSSNSVLNGQNTLNNIITNEMTDLNNRINKITEETDSAKRILQLNEYSRLKTADYNYILYYVIGTIILLNILFIIKKIIPGIPSSFYEITIVVIICISLYLIYYRYMDILKRDIIYYDELAIPNPSNINLNQNQINSVNAGNGITTNVVQNSGSNICANETCCDNVTTTWDTIQKQCVSIDQETSLTNQRNTSVQAFTLMDEVQPNYFNEFSNYSQV